MRIQLRSIVIVGAVSAGALATLSLLLILHPRVEPLRDMSGAPRIDSPVAATMIPGGERIPAAADSEPTSVASLRDADTAGLPRAPANARELQEFTHWLHGLSHDQLLLLSNAEFDFEESQIIETLRDLDGDWVVPELGKLALGETDPLIKAILVTGLCKGAGRDRLNDPRMLEGIELLLPQLSSAEADPFKASRYVVFSAYGACVCQKADFAGLVLPHLEGSDNPDLLVRGYLFLGQSPGADDVLARAVSDHPSADGRFGALEGLREAGLKGRVPPHELTRIGLAALERESTARNRLLLVEMIASAGGESGLHALESMVAGGEPGLVGPAASMIAVKLDPERAQETLEKALASGTLSREGRASVYQALGAVPGERSWTRLVGAIRDEELPEGERLDALRGLWNRPADEGLRRELAELAEGDQPGALRAESLRLLAFSGAEGASMDTRGLAENDRDANVRREAVLLSALQPGADQKGWLEERLLNDRSEGVRAAALGAMVVQARYTGEGESVRGHLERVKRMSDDPGVQALVARGEQMLGEYDSRRMDLELRRDAEFYRDIAVYTSGPARQAMERQAEYYRRMVAVLEGLTGKR